MTRSQSSPNRFALMRARIAIASVALLALAFITTSAWGAQPLSPSNDLAESTEAGWYCGPSGQCTVTADRRCVHSQEASIHFRTESDADTWVGLRPSPEANWDVSKFDYLEFRLRVKNEDHVEGQSRPLRFLRENHFDNEGFFRLGDSAGNYFQYTPANAHSSFKLLSAADRRISDGWLLFRVPLKGSNRWTITRHGKPRLTDIDYFELHGDSRGHGFDLWLDGVRFRAAGTPPSPPPPPPAGVNPDAMEVKLLVYVVNPVLESKGGRRLFDFQRISHQRDTVDLAIASILKASHGLVRYKIVDFLEVDAWPVYHDGFQYTDALWLKDRSRHKFHTPSEMSIPRLARDLGWDMRAMAGEFDEMWLVSPGMGVGEAGMLGEGAYNINGPIFPAPDSTSTRAYLYVTGPVRPGDYFWHCYSHRLEETLTRAFGGWAPPAGGWRTPMHPRTLDAHAWDRFTLLDRDLPGQGAIGSCHQPVNAVGDYDHGNTRPVLTSADNWLYNYPNMSGDERREVDDKEWGSHDWRYQLWLYRHMPHVPGVNDGKTGAYKHPADEGILNNWWRYVIDVEQFKWRDGRFLDDWTAPQVVIKTPSAGSVHGVVPVKVETADENPISRVDLYVDGRFYATDALAPYTFEWDASTLAGAHTLVAKAYDMPHGWEGVSAPLTMRVEPMSKFNSPLLEPIGDANGHLYAELGSPLEFTIAATDDDPPLTYSAENLPQGATLDAQTGKFSWLPEAGQNGHYWTRLAVTDADGDRDSEAVVVVVTTPVVVAGFEVDRSSGEENLRHAKLAVTLDPVTEGFTGTVKVDYSVTGGRATGGGVDYALADGTLAFPSGQVRRDIVIPLVDDTLLETPETIEVTLSNPVNAILVTGRGKHTYTILDDDTARVARYTKKPVDTETAGPNWIGRYGKDGYVLWSNPSRGTHTSKLPAGWSVDVQGEVADWYWHWEWVQGRSDPHKPLKIDAPDQPLAVPDAGSLPPTGGAAGTDGGIHNSPTLSILVTVPEAVEVFNLTLYCVSVHELQRRQALRINEDEASEFDIGCQSATGPFGDRGPGPGGQGHYTTWQIETGGARQFVVTIRQTGPYTATASGLFIDVPEMTVGFDTAHSKVREAAAPAQLTVSLARPSHETVTVEYSTTGGTATGRGIDYELALGKLEFAPGETTRNIAVSIVEDNLDEAAETFEITLSNPTNAKLDPARAKHTYTIAPYDAVTLSPQENPRARVFGGSTHGPGDPNNLFDGRRTTDNYWRPAASVGIDFGGVATVKSVVLSKRASPLLRVAPETLNIYYQGPDGTVCETIRGFTSKGRETITRSLAAPIKTRWIAVGPASNPQGLSARLEVSEIEIIGAPPASYSALVNLAAGKKVRLEGWNGAGEWLADDVWFNGPGILGEAGAGTGVIEIDFGSPTETRSLAILSSISQRDHARVKEVELTFCDEGDFSNPLGTRTASVQGGNALDDSAMGVFDYEPITARHVRIRPFGVYLHSHDIRAVINEILFLNRKLASHETK